MNEKKKKKQRWLLSTKFYYIIDSIVILIFVVCSTTEALCLTWLSFVNNLLNKISVYFSWIPVVNVWTQQNPGFKTLIFKAGKLYSPRSLMKYNLPISIYTD